MDRQKVFLNYRWRDGTRTALEIIQLLWDRGYSAWWDRSSLPRHVAEGNHSFDPVQLEASLFEDLKSCDKAIILRTPSFGNSAWTQTEDEIIDHLSKLGMLEKFELEMTSIGAINSKGSEYRKVLDNFIKENFPKIA